MNGDAFSDDDAISDDQDLNGVDPEIGEDTETHDDAYHCFTGHSNSVFCVAWSPVNDCTVASGGQDDLGYLWQTWIPDSEIHALPCELLEGHSDSVIAISFNHSGELLATGGMDGVVKIWNKDGSVLQTLDGPTDAIMWIYWHPRGDVILAGAADFATWMWNASTGACMQVLTGHSAGVSNGRFSSDGRLVITCGDEGDCSLRIWNPRTGECTSTIAGHNFHQSGITCLDVNAEGSLALTGSSDHTARLSNLVSGQPVGTLSGHTDSVECAGFIEGMLPVIMTGSLDQKVIAWDTSTLTQRHSYLHPDAVVCLDAMKQSPVIATGCLDGIVRLWDSRTNTSMKEMTGFAAAIQCLQLSPDEKMIMAGSDDTTVRIFDIRQN